MSQLDASRFGRAIPSTPPTLTPLSTTPIPLTPTTSPPAPSTTPASYPPTTPLYSPPLPPPLPPPFPHHQGFYSLQDAALQEMIRAQNWVGPQLQVIPLVALPTQYGYPDQRIAVPQTIDVPHFLRRQTEPIIYRQRRATRRRDVQRTNQPEVQDRRRDLPRQLTDLCQRQALKVDRQIERSLIIPSQLLKTSSNYFSFRPISPETIAQHSLVSVYAPEDSESSGQAPSGLGRPSTPQTEASHETKKAEKKRAARKRLRSAFYSRPNEIVVVPPTNWYYEYVQELMKEILEENDFVKLEYGAF